MKKSIILFIAYFICNTVLFSQETVNSINWIPQFKEALNKSKKEKKPILIYFTGSDWCGPCKTLDKNLFHSEKFSVIANKNLLLYKADIPRNKDLINPDKLKENNKLLDKHKIKTFPTLVFVNHKGKVIGYKKGLILTDYYYPFIQSVIDNY